MRILIVGQGIAGTTLAWALMRRKATVYIADGNLPHSASLSAAGLINPITGKFYAKTWRYDDFFPVARRFYRDMEAALHLSSLWTEVRVLRVLDTPKALNDWALRMTNPTYAGLVGMSSEAEPWSEYLCKAYPLGETRGAARVDFSKLLTAFRKYMTERGLFIPQNLSPEAVLAMAMDYDAVVFCEGWRGALNPFFPTALWQLTFGEALLVRFLSPHLPHLRDVLKKGLLLVPVKNGVVWAGGTYRRWSPPEPIPQPNSTAMVQTLQQLLHPSFELLRTMGGIRPTVRDRRPLLGGSPVQSAFFLFNGLGTKGALLAPHWAEHMADHLLRGSALDREVSLSRS